MIIKFNDLFCCLFNEFAEFNYNRFKINLLWIFIINDSFNQYALFITTRILKDSSILSFNFLNDLEVIMFLEFRNIMSFIS